MGPRRAVVLAGALLLAAGAPATASPYHFRAGAARLDTTPPAAGSAAGDQADSEFARGFAACPSAVFGSQGRFALQEPFNDLNGDGQWDAGTDLSHGPDGKKPDPFCDVNANGRWDGLYADNNWGPVSGVHDAVDVRAVAISDGHHPPLVYASVDAIGLFDYYTEQARWDLVHRYGLRANLVVSADHNESSPDTIGLYGAGETPLGVGVRSGIDEYYMRFLDDRIARAAAAAIHHMVPAELYANQIEGSIPGGTSGNRYPLLSGLSERISDQFPTSVALPRDDRVAAVDPKLGVLQARDTGGTPIFTTISIAAHNQEMGNSGASISADWPGAMVNAFEAGNPGLAMFLVGDNGSMEDPQTNPTVIPSGSENHTSQASVGDVQSEIQTDRYTFTRAQTVSELNVLNDIYPALVRRNGYVFLGYANVTKGQSTVSSAGDLITYAYPTKFLDDNKDLIYSSDGSRVYH